MLSLLNSWNFIRILTSRNRSRFSIIMEELERTLTFPTSSGDTAAVFVLKERKGKNHRWMSWMSRLFEVLPLILLKSFCDPFMKKQKIDILKLILEILVSMRKFVDTFPFCVDQGFHLEPKNDYFLFCDGFINCYMNFIL